MKFYEIFYPESKVTQTKVLISHEEYLKYKYSINDSEEQILFKKQQLKKLTGGNEWFTDKSPLYKAISTGVLNCNGSFLCIIKLIS